MAVQFPLVYLFGKWEGGKVGDGWKELCLCLLSGVPIIERGEIALPCLEFCWEANGGDYFCPSFQFFRRLQLIQYIFSDTTDEFYLVILFLNDFLRVPNFVCLRNQMI